MSDHYDERFETENVTPLRHEHVWIKQEVCRDCGEITELYTSGPLQGHKIADPFDIPKEGGRG
jgi:hypothetical protein